VFDSPPAPLFGRLFWVVTVGLALGGVATATELFSVGTAAGFAIGVAALLPSLLWVRGRVLGLPIFPIVCLTYVWTSAVPLVQGNAAVTRYELGEQLVGAATVVGFLLLGTLCWAVSAGRTVTPVTHYWGFPEDPNGVGLLTLLAIGCVFISPLPWVLFPTLGPNIHSALKMGFVGLAVLSVSVLGYQWGRGKLAIGAKVLFASLGGLFAVIETAGLLVHGATALSFSVAVTYTLGRGRPPLLFLAVALSVASLLHLGKWPMRERYWSKQESMPGYVELYQEWFGYAFDELAAKTRNADDPTGRQSTASAPLERASVLHMLLLVETRSPGEVPHLMGDTYAIIPELLLPRFLSPNKPWAHESTYRLSIHYGLQTREQTKTTTIGFGLLAESYANFGYVGVAGLAVLVGAVAGGAMRWGRGRPISSFRGLFGLLVLSALLQTESALGVATNSLFQATVALSLVGLVFMRSLPLTPAGTHEPVRGT
jgi:hypothetical protein